jgi:hypothetical protein
VDIHIDFRPMDTQHALSVLRGYIDVVEPQMEEVLRCERIALDAQAPEQADEEDIQLFRNEQQALEDFFERDLIPTMHYSVVVFIHIVFETRLRSFCAAMQRERNIPVGLGDIRGSAIEQARTYLSKLVGVAVGEYPEWSQLRSLQYVRDCIVHSYGYVDSEDDRSKHLRQLATQNIGLSISEDDRLLLSKSFCDQHVAHLSRLFNRLFAFAGWRP